MTAKATLVAEIVAKVRDTKYVIWRIGLTHDLAERKKYWSETEDEIIKYWSDWEADSLSDAQEIESYFINENHMKESAGGELSPHRTVYVYVF
jgi:hypothetical protein